MSLARNHKGMEDYREKSFHPARAFMTNICRSTPPLPSFRVAIVASETFSSEILREIGHDTGRIAPNEKFQIGLRIG